MYDAARAFDDAPEAPHAAYDPAMVQLPHRIPLGFHGLFVHSDEVSGKVV